MPKEHVGRRVGGCGRLGVSDLLQPSFALLQTSLQTRSGTTSENAILEKVDVVYQKNEHLISFIPYAILW